MADVEARIAEWRQALQAQGSPAAVVEELEGHLREEVRRQLLAGRPPEQAFALAADRLGTPAALAAEFAKNAPAAWLPARLALLLAVAWAGWVGGYMSARIQADTDPLLGYHVTALTLGYTLTLLIGVLGGAYLVARSVLGVLPQHGHAVTRAALILTLAAVGFNAVGILLGGFCSLEKFNRFWGWEAKELGGLTIVLWNLATLFVYARRVGNELVRLLVPLAGNVVVVLGWFGAAALDNGRSLHNYSDPILTTVWLIVLVHAAAMSLALLPARRPALSR